MLIGVPKEIKTAENRADAAEARADRLAAALEQIRGMGGRVCPLFEVCEHDSCADSSGAYLVAGAALAAPAEGEGDANG